MPLDGLTLKRRFRRFLGSSVEFDLAPYMARHARIDRLATEVAATDDAGLTAWARRLKTRVGEGVSLDQVLDELFALAREASERVLGTMHRRESHPEAHVLDVPKARLNPPALAVVANQDPRRDLRFAGHQAPRFVHLRILYAHDRADRQLVRVGHPSTHQPPRARPPAPTHAAAVRRSPPALVT